jgi:hypothetical protein
MFFALRHLKTIFSNVHYVNQQKVNDWRLISRVLSGVDWQIATYVSKVLSTFFFRVKQVFYSCFT